MVTLRSTADAILQRVGFASSRLPDHSFEHYITIEGKKVQLSRELHTLFEDLAELVQRPRVTYLHQVSPVHWEGFIDEKQAVVIRVLNKSLSYSIGDTFEKAYAAPQTIVSQGKNLTTDEMKSAMADILEFA